MYARFSATLCLLCVSTFTALADSAVPPSTALEVYVKGQEGSTPDVLAAMNRELDALMLSAGFRVVWRGAADPPSIAGAEHLVMVELRGVCMAQFAGLSAPLFSIVPLASSSVVNGKILPFSWLDCTALNRFLAPVASNQAKAVQDELYGRSMARLLAHELYHVLGQTDYHAPGGIAKARFSIADLLADDFKFETMALERLRPSSAAVSVDDTSVGGR